MLVSDSDASEASRRAAAFLARPDPLLVDRAFDPSLCAYCDESRRVECTACTRPMCELHRPWQPDAFCYACEAEWRRGARRRQIVLALAVILWMAVVTAAIGGIMAITDASTIGFGALLLPVVSAVPCYLRLERSMRRRFDRRGSLPPAAIARRIQP